MMMKKILGTVFIMGVLLQGIYAQEEGKFRLGLDVGYAIPDGEGGILVALEPKYNIANNMNVGLRVEGAALAKDVNSNEFSTEAEGTFNVSVLGTFDYYFNTSSTSSFAPFIGGGLGYYALTDVEINDNDFTNQVTIERETEVEDKFGGLIRAGVEWGKFRLAASYNIVGDSDLGNGVDVNNSYVGLSLGFYAGGGKWGL